MSDWHPVDLVVLILASGMAFAMMATTLVPLVLKKPISDERTKSVAAVADRMLLVIAGYIGFVLGGGPG